MTEGSNPIVFVGFVLTTLIIGVIILAKLTARRPHDKNSDLDKT